MLGKLLQFLFLLREQLAKVVQFLHACFLSVNIKHQLLRESKAVTVFVVYDYCGHGVGVDVHEDPSIPNDPNFNGANPRIKPGMVLALEPMINMGRCDVEWLDDDWTVVAEDGLPSSHYENTVLITEGEPEILTLL